MKYQVFVVAFAMNVFLIDGMEPIETFRVKVGQKISVKIVQYGNIHPCLFVDHPDKSILGFEGTDSVSVHLPEAEYPQTGNLRNILMYIYTAIKPGTGMLTFWTDVRTNEHKQTRTIIVDP